MAKKSRNNKGFWSHNASRAVLVHMDFHKSISDSFTRAIDAYLIEHKLSEQEDRWMRDFISNSSKAARELFKSLYRAPHQVYTKYYTEEDNGKCSEESKQEGAALPQVQTSVPPQEPGPGLKPQQNDFTETVEDK